jgi:hypothetical protein
LVELFLKSSRVRAAPEEAAFLFCQAFFFVPLVAKKKASNKSSKHHGYCKTDKSRVGATSGRPRAFTERPYGFVPCDRSAANGAAPPVPKPHKGKAK